MAKVVVREECFNFSLLLLSLFLFYGDRQWQDCLIWRFSITGCLGYVCRRQKGSTLKGKKMSWKGTLPWLLIPICNLGSKYGNYLSCVAIGTQEQKRVCPEWKCASLWSEDDKLQKNYRIFFFFFFLRRYIFKAYSIGHKVQDEWLWICTMNRISLQRWWWYETGIVRYAFISDSALFKRQILFSCKQTTDKPIVF